MGALPFPPLPSPALPSLFSPLFHSLPSRPLLCPNSPSSSLPTLRSRPCKYSCGVCGSDVSSPNAVWGEAPADKRFGAYLSQKGLLWWQQFFVEFFATTYVIFIIFCTKIINVQKVCPKISNDYIWISCWSCCLSDYFERFGSTFPTLNIWQLRNTSKYCAKY